MDSTDLPTTMNNVPHIPTTIDSLPNELMLSIFPFFPLKSLIVSRGVSKEWRHFAEVSFVPPARRALLLLYLQVIKSPSFLQSRVLLAPEIRDINREEYIRNIEEETGVSLPEEFRMWVLEWPLKAVTTWLWPGLDSIQPRHLHDVFTRQTMNLLKSIGMHPRKIQLRHRSTEDDTVVLRPMRHTDGPVSPQDWCWMIIVQVARDPFAMDFLLFGGEGLGSGVRDTVLVVRDEVVRPGMGWVEYLRKELQKQDECYLKKIAGSSPLRPHKIPPVVPIPQPVPQRSRFQFKIRGPLRAIKRMCVGFLESFSL